MHWRLLYDIKGAKYYIYAVYYMISKVVLFMTKTIPSTNIKISITIQLPKMQKNLRDAGIECPGDIGPVWRQVFEYYVHEISQTNIS